MHYLDPTKKASIDKANIAFSMITHERPLAARVITSNHRRGAAVEVNSLALVRTRNNRSNLAFTIKSKPPVSCSASMHQ